MNQSKVATDKDLIIKKLKTDIDKLKRDRDDALHKKL